ncbi:MAG: S1 RNA-binding domain-containing protein [Candidatus Micrarchaeota archaeon]
MKPQLNDLAIGLVKKVMPFGAIISLIEFNNAEAFVHISEVSSGWVKNIREHLKEGQLVVAKVTLVDNTKNQVDVSVKRVSEVEKKRKLADYQSQKRALKILERLAKKTSRTLQEMQKLVEPLVEEYGDLYTVFEALSHDHQPNAKIPKKLLTELIETAKKEIKIKIIELKAEVKAISYSTNGLNEIKKFLEKLPTPHYLGSGKYKVSVSSPEIKQAEKQMQAIEQLIDKTNSSSFECSIERLK